MADQQAPGAGPSTPDRRPLRRRTEGRLIAGVAAGVADHLGVDVVIVRILFVVTAVFTNGLGLVAYLLGWIFIPADDVPDATTGPRSAATPQRADGWSRDPLFWVGIGLLIVGAVWLLDGPLGPARWFPALFDRGLVLPLVLIGFGIALWRAGDRRSTPSPPPTAPPVVPAHPASTSEATMPSTHPHPDAPATTHDPTPPDGPDEPGRPPPPGGQGGSQPPAWTPPPEPSRERSMLGRVTVGVALVAAGTLWLLRVAGAAPVGVGRITAAALLVIGLGLVVGSFAGRARWLIVVGLLLAPIVIAAELMRPIGLGDLPRWTVRGPVGEIVSAPASVEELRSSYQLGAGQLDLDLSALDLEEDTRVDVQVGAGEARIVVPDDVTVHVTARAGAGEVRLFGESASGVGIERSARDDGPSDVVLELDIQVGLGEARVERAAGSVPAEEARTDYLVPLAQHALTTRR